jgi:hypothetical protein
MSITFALLLAGLGGLGLILLGLACVRSGANADRQHAQALLDSLTQEGEK